jgi:hypothetical protein
MKTKLEVSVPGEPDRHFPIDTRAIVGKGSTADVSLDGAAGVMAQHFRVKLGPNDVDVRLAPGGRPLTYEGRPFAGGPLPYGSDFYLDRVRFRIARPKQDSGKKTVPLLLACAVVVVGVGLSFAFDNNDADPGPPVGEAEVVLFPEAPACPATDPAAAARKAENLEKAAQTKRERYRYAAHDGLDAGRLFSQASRCYAAAGDVANQQRVDQDGQAWRSRITDEFRAAQLRLQTAVQNNQYEVALSAVISMRRMLAGETLPYAHWLLAKQRQLNSDIAKRNKAASPLG